MSDSTDSAKSDRGPLETLIHYLNEYKELVTALLFFAGGAVWIADYFATKDELKSLREMSSKQNM